MPTPNHRTIGFYGACDDSSEKYVLRQIADIKSAGTDGFTADKINTPGK